MPQKRRPTPAAAKTVKAGPIQDTVTAQQQAGQFPSVGMTLRSYQYDPKDYHKRSAGRAVVLTQNRWRRFRQGVTLKRAVLVSALLILVVGGWLGGKFAYNAHKLFGGNIFSVLTTTKLKGEDSGRVNILLAGNSSDDPGHSGGSLTDSIMLVSIDTRAHKAFLLSIPRDLWVHIPGDGHEKINDAYVLGQADGFNQSGYPAGGMGQLEQVVSQDLGVPINYYALIDYNAMKQAVNAVGGVDVTIKSSDPRGLYDPSIDYATHGPLVNKLTNGTHHLDGEQALDLARARGDAYGSYGFPAADFDRTQHQRQLLVALKTKAVSVGVLANPAKLSSLSDAIGNNVKTDFKLSEVHRLYDLVNQISGQNIQSLSFNQANGKDLLASYGAPDGESALIPAAGIDNFSALQAYIKQQTSSDPVVQEGATIAVLNGTTTNGLANKVKQRLTAKQLTVSSTGNSPNPPQATTVIIDTTGGKKPATGAALVKLFGNHLTTQNTYGLTYNADFIVILGADQVPPVTPAPATSQ
jgi:LCP family protein required for cell wall assembly